MKRRSASFLAALAVVVGGLLAVPTTAAAQAAVERFSFPFTAGPEEVDDTCAGQGVVGVLTGAGTVAGQQVETDNGFHVRVTITFLYRVDFPGGSYLLAAQREPIVFNDNLQGGVITVGGTLLEKGTLYDAAGTVIGHEMFHARFRTTIVDGTAVVEFDEGFITCR